MQVRVGVERGEREFHRAAHAHLVGNPYSSCTASHRLSPFGWPMVESFFGGDCAEALEDRHAACAFAIDELVASGATARGVIVDGAGIGSSMAANKVPGIRAAVEAAA